MPVVVVNPPATALVSLEDAKKQLRVDHDDDDNYIQGLVAAIVRKIDGPAGWLNRALITQTLEWRGDEFGTCDIRLPYPPIASIVSIKFDDDDGVEQTVSSSDYRLVGQPNMPRVALAYGSSWPSARCQSEAVRVQYLAGYGATSDSVPENIRHWVLLNLSELYENREVASDKLRVETSVGASLIFPSYLPA